MNLSTYLNKEIFKVVANVAQQNNIESYIIGGYVRDIILHRPSKDIDIVAIGSGIAFAEKIALALGKKTAITVFKTYGTAQIKHNGLELELVGARKESYNRDSRNPIVEEGTLSDDQNRRDFTINALAISLNKETFGELLDPFNGLEDMQDRVIRTPLDPDITFSDDPLRMMRAIRFATQLNFEIEATTLKSISKNRERIKIITKERINDELHKIIMSSKPSIGFKLLTDTGLLAIIFPELEMMKGVEVVDGRSHKDNFYHTLTVLDNLCEISEDPWLRWSALLHDIGKPSTKKYDSKHGWMFHNHNFIGSRMVPSIFKRMKLPMNEKMKFVTKMVDLHMRPIILAEEVVTDSAVRRLLCEAGDDIDALMTLCEADITSKNQDKVKKYLNNFRLVRQKLKEIEEKDHVRNFQPPISGEMIMKTFQIPAGKVVGDIKLAIKEAIMDGKIQNNYEDAYQLMLDLGKEYGL